MDGLDGWCFLRRTTQIGFVCWSKKKLTQILCKFSTNCLHLHRCNLKSRRLMVFMLLFYPILDIETSIPRKRGGWKRIVYLEPLCTLFSLLFLPIHHLDPVERETVRMADAAWHRKKRARTVRNRVAPDVLEKQRIYDETRCDVLLASLDADPVDKERFKLSVLQRQKERRARLNADPETMEKYLVKDRIASKKNHRDTKRAISDVE